MIIAELIIGYIFIGALTFIFYPRKTLLDIEDIAGISLGWIVTVPIIFIIFPSIMFLFKIISLSRDKVQSYFKNRSVKKVKKPLTSKKDIKRQEDYRLMHCQACGNPTDRLAK